MTQQKIMRTAITIAIAGMVSSAQAQSEQDRESQSEALKVEAWTPRQVVITARRPNYTATETSTATRTETPLIEVPQSVQVLTRSLIEEQDRRTLGDALVNVSGVVPTRSEELLFIPPLVRGFPAEVYLDGLPIYAGNQQAFDPTSLVGVERVEVLKGPSATLYGGGWGRHWAASSISNPNVRMPSWVELLEYERAVFLPVTPMPTSMCP